MLLTMPKDTSMIKLVMDFKIRRLSSNHLSLPKQQVSQAGQGVRGGRGGGGWSESCSGRGREWRNKADRFEGKKDLVCHAAFVKECK